MYDDCGERQSPFTGSSPMAPPTASQASAGHAVLLTGGIGWPEFAADAVWLQTNSA
jgi:hypothetical protein